MIRTSYRLLPLLLLALLALAGCRREVVAPGDPVAAVKGLAQAVHDNDLVRYSRLSMPPALHKQMEARWKANLALAPLPTPAQEKDYTRWMGRLTEPQAEKIDLKKVKAWLDEHFEDPLWDGIATRCVGCGACAFVCPRLPLLRYS